ncbi:MAG: hypothetical protein ACM3NR_04120 [Methanosarcina sp.]
MIKIRIPDFAYDLALKLAISREGRFRNQFTTKKLREQLSDDVDLMKHVEGVFGYIGDMCAATWLGLDPKELMRNMILDTDLLTHRDEYDMVYKGVRVDVKTEFYPPEKFDKVVNNTITKKETYGCRLINDNQFRENSGTIDVYLFATLDNLDPRLAKYWYGIGWITTAEAKEIAPKPMWWSPAGARLWTPAHCIPNEELHHTENLLTISQGSHSYHGNHRENPRFMTCDKTKFNGILSRCGLN